MTLLTSRTFVNVIVPPLDDILVDLVHPKRRGLLRGRAVGESRRIHAAGGGSGGPMAVEVVNTRGLTPKRASWI